MQLSAFVNEWNEALETYGPGTIDLKLDELVLSPDAHRQFVSMIHVIEDEIKDTEMHVLTSMLNTQCRVIGVRFIDYRGDLLTKAIANLRRLLQ